MIRKLLALKSHQGFTRYFKNTSWMIGEQILRMIAGLFVGIWVAQYLGPTQFGLFNYVLAFFAIFSGITRLGLDRIVVRNIVSHPEKCNIYLGTAFWLKLTAALILLAVALIALPLSGQDHTTNLYVFIVTAALVFQSFEVIEFYFQSQVKAITIIKCKTAQLALSSLIKIYLVITQGELIMFVMVAAFDAASIAINYFIAYKTNKRQSFYSSFDPRVAKKLLIDSLPLMLAGLSFTLLSNADTILIKILIDEESVGIYNAAYRLSTLWYFLPGLILSSFMPAIVSVKNNEIEYRKRTETITGVLLWFAVTLALLTTILSDEIIKYTFGPDFDDSRNSLIILIWVNVVIFFNSCWNQWHIVEKKSGLVFYFHTTSLIFNITLNLALIPIFGIEGSAYSLLIATIASLAIFSFKDRKTMQLLISSISFWKWHVNKK